MSKKDVRKKAGFVLEGFFSEPQKTASEPAETVEPVNTPEKKETAKKGKKTDTHKPFSFWAVKEEADDWRIWAKAKGMKVDDLGALAIREYIKRHKLTDDQKQIYELMKK